MSIVDKETIELHKMLTDKLVKHGLISVNAKREWLNDLENETKTEKLLTIEIDDINSVPVVHYKGEKLNPISEFDLTWKTKTHLPGHISFDIEHSVEKGKRERLGFERGFKSDSSFMSLFPECGAASGMNSRSIKIDMNGMDLVDTIYDHIDKRITESKINGS